ncbi:MAG: endo-1,4-beta-xylanase [Flavobacterium sp.]|nr:endo-1,4-beta-xylanase [Flavobacterium sp.]
MKKIRVLFFLSVVTFTACKKDSYDSGLITPTPPTPIPTPTSVPFKSVATFPIAIAASNGAFTSNALSAEIIRRDFNGITFENEMKNNALINGSGVFNYVTADAMVAAAQTDNIQVHGHVLAWHAQTQGGLYRSILEPEIPSSISGLNLILNPGFENGNATSFTNFSVLNSGNPIGSATITVGSGASEVRSGTRSMKVVNPTAYGSEQWRVQIACDPVTLVIGKQYQVSFWIKAATANGSVRLSTSPAALYQADQTIGTAWQQVIWVITATATDTRITFDIGRNSNTYFVDDVAVNAISPASYPAVNYSKVDSVLRHNITQIATRYKGKVRGWDVINEMFADGPAGSLRSNRNTANATNNDVFVWTEYLGRDFGVNAFKYAEQADPTAKLFINDYGLESSTAKLDSLISYVAEIKARGAKVDGIGTQMHININNNKDLIDAHFKKLAATGLLVHLSELDIGVNTSNATTLSFTDALETAQADMYNYAVLSYMRNVPKAQRYGVTIWGVLDNQSWRYSNGADYPLIYNPSGIKKKAYEAVLNALKSGL